MSEPFVKDQAHRERIEKGEAILPSYPETAELLYLANQQAYARNRYNEEDSGLIRESTVIEWALRFAALPSSGGVAQGAREPVVPAISITALIGNIREYERYGSINTSVANEICRYLNRALAQGASLPSGDCGIYSEVAARRGHQIAKGYDADHDDGHADGSIARGAAALALTAFGPVTILADRRRHGMYRGREELTILPSTIWPWDNGFHFRGTRDALIDAAAMIVAEIERLDRGSSLPSTLRQCPICARRVASPCETLAIATSCPLSSTDLGSGK